MKAGYILTTVDIPAPLYRRLEEQAAVQGCFAGELIVRGVEKLLLDAPPRPRHRVQFPLIRSAGPKVSVSNDQIYEHSEFA